MRYHVDILPAALRDAEEAYQWWQAHSPGRAVSWFDGLISAVNSLEEHPARCPVIQESEELGIEIRQLLYGNRPTSTYRILFRIREEGIVRVLRIRHCSRDRL